MNRSQLLATWSWLVVTVLIEVTAVPYLSSLVWTVRGSIETIVALTAVIPMILFYMGLNEEHLSVKMFVVCAIFFCLDLILIWSASSVH